VVLSLVIWTKLTNVNLENSLFVFTGSEKDENGTPEAIL
jgi:hypothetical protein